MVLFPLISDQRFLLEFRRRLLWPCPQASAYPDTLENRDFFFLRHSLPSTLKRRFGAPKMQVFGNGNAGSSFSCGQTKTEVFKNADVHSRPQSPSFLGHVVGSVTN